MKKKNNTKCNQNIFAGEIISLSSKKKKKCPKFFGIDVICHLCLTN